MFKVSPSIASCNLINVESELEKTVGCNNLHIDIEDGNFVPNITFGMKFVKQLRKYTDTPFSVHLMCLQPEDFIEDLKELNCSHVFVHPENVMYLRRLLYQMKKTGSKVGLAINPSSNILDYEYAFDLIDAVLYVTSEPDANQEKFIDSTLDKIKFFVNKEIWLDGGIDNQILKKLKNKKIDYVVKGRSFFNAK